MPGPPPPPPNVGQGRTKTSSGERNKISPYQNTTSNNNNNNCSAPSRIASNVSQFGNLKFMIILSFWLVFLFEGIYSSYYCDLLSASLSIWSNDNDNYDDGISPTGCYDSELFDTQHTSYTSKYKNYTLIELSEACSNDGSLWIWIGVLGLWITFYIFSKLLLNIGAISKLKGNRYHHKTYFQCNYILAHIVSMPIFTLIVGISQGLLISNSFTSYVIAFVFRHSENNDTLYYWQTYFSVHNCDALWDDMEDITNHLIVVLNVAYFAFIFYGFFVPFIVMIMYMVRGKIVFFENKKFHCLIYFNWCNQQLYGNDHYRMICNYCELACCIDKSKQQGTLDAELDRYNSASVQF